MLGSNLRRIALFPKEPPLLDEPRDHLVYQIRQVRGDFRFQRVRQALKVVVGDMGTRRASYGRGTSKNIYPLLEFFMLKRRARRLHLWRLWRGRAGIALTMLLRLTRRGWWSILSLVLLVLVMLLLSDSLRLMLLHSLQGSLLLFEEEFVSHVVHSGCRGVRVFGWEGRESVVRWWLRSRWFKRWLRT